MSSLLRRMQLRNVRASRDPATARRLRGQLRGKGLGYTNPKAPKPLSRRLQGKKRGVVNRSFREPKAVVQYLSAVPYRASTRAERAQAHANKMIRKGYR